MSSSQSTLNNRVESRREKGQESKSSFSSSNPSLKAASDRPSPTSVSRTNYNESYHSTQHQQQQQQQYTRQDQTIPSSLFQQRQVPPLNNNNVPSSTMYGPSSNLRHPPPPTAHYLASRSYPPPPPPSCYDYRYRSNKSPIPPPPLVQHHHHNRPQMLSSSSTTTPTRNIGNISRELGSSPYDHYSYKYRPPPGHVLSSFPQASNSMYPPPPSSTTLSFPPGTYRTPPPDFLTSNSKAAAVGCTCKKSRCLKLYCQCFAASITCGPKCKCSECYNTTQHGSHIALARNAILVRNSTAFDTVKVSLVPAPTVGARTSQPPPPPAISTRPPQPQPREFTPIQSGVPRGTISTVPRSSSWVASSSPQRQLESASSPSSFLSRPYGTGIMGTSRDGPPSAAFVRPMYHPPPSIYSTPPPYSTIIRTASLSSTERNHQSLQQVSSPSLQSSSMSVSPRKYAQQPPPPTSPQGLAVTSQFVTGDRWKENTSTSPSHPNSRQRVMEEWAESRQLPSQPNEDHPQQAQPGGYFSSIHQQVLLLTRQGCKCRRSSCLKKYCDCYLKNTFCAEHCKCLDCKNTTKNHCAVIPKFGSLTNTNSSSCTSTSAELKSKTQSSVSTKNTVITSTPNNLTLLSTPPSSIEDWKVGHGEGVGKYDLQYTNCNNFETTIKDESTEETDEKQQHETSAKGVSPDQSSKFASLYRHDSEVDDDEEKKQDEDGSNFAIRQRRQQQQERERYFPQYYPYNNEDQNGRTSNTHNDHQDRDDRTTNLPDPTDRLAIMAAVAMTELFRNASPEVKTPNAGDINDSSSPNCFHDILSPQSKRKYENRELDDGRNLSTVPVNDSEMVAVAVTPSSATKEDCPKTRMLSSSVDGADIASHQHHAGPFKKRRQSIARLPTTRVATPTTNDNEVTHTNTSSTTETRNPSPPATPPARSIVETRQMNSPKDHPLGGANATKSSSLQPFVTPESQQQHHRKVATAQSSITNGGDDYSSKKPSTTEVSLLQATPAGGILLPKSLSFRKICSRCGKTRAEHGELGFGNQCVFQYCGKCGAGLQYHEQASQPMGILCQLTVAQGAIPGSVSSYNRKIQQLALHAAADTAQKQHNQRQHHGLLTSSSVHSSDEGTNKP